jgi:hypothetical protein
MSQELTISEARKKLPSLLKEIQQDASRSFVIKVHKEAVATLSAVKKVTRKGMAVKALLRMIEHQKEQKTGEASVHSENFKEFLYERQAD